MLSSRRSRGGRTLVAQQLTEKAKAHRLILPLWLGITSIFVIAPCAAAQTDGLQPIKVESDEVVVPVLVLDAQRVAQYEKTDAMAHLTEEMAGDFHSWDDLPIRDLVASDFHVFEDGQEQRIRNVTYGTPPITSVRDNFGPYSEFVGSGGGIWVVPDVRVDSNRTFVLNLPALPRYLISYVAPGSSDGSCHQVTVKVGRPDSLVYARSQYCNARHSGADPLNGTKLGERMESDSASAKSGGIGLSLAAVPLFAVAPATRVAIYLEFAPKSLKFLNDDCTPTPPIGILGELYTKDGTLAARFSDQASGYGDVVQDAHERPLVQSTSSGPTTCLFYGPSRYQREVNAPPGQYNLRVVVRHGGKFGRAEIPLNVNSYSDNRLAISGITVAKRFRELPAESPEVPTVLPGSYKPLVSKGVEIIPAADSRFRKGETFCFYFEVYEPQQPGSPPATVEFHLRILDAKTDTLMKELRPADAAPYSQPGNPVIPVGGGIDISSLPRGSYRLETQATDSTGQSTTWQATSFTVE